MSKKREYSKKIDAILGNLLTISIGALCIGLGAFLCYFILTYTVMDELFILLPENASLLIASLIIILVSFIFGAYMVIRGLIKTSQDIKAIKKIKEKPDEETVYF